MNRHDQEKITAIRARARREKRAKNSGPAAGGKKRKKARLVINGFFAVVAVLVVLGALLGSGDKNESAIPLLIFLGWPVIWYNVSSVLFGRTTSRINAIGGGFLISITYFPAALIAYTSIEEANALEEAERAGFSSINEHENARRRGFSVKRDLVEFERKEAINKERRAHDQALAKKIAKDERVAKQKERSRLRAEKCRRDLGCWAQKYVFTASRYCQGSIERLAKYDFQWTDGGGIFDSKFTHFRWKDKSDLTVTYLGDKLKLQNGFGAWQYHKYECDYDPQAKSILAVRVSPGRLTN
ncbi:MAG: hypothetical protein RPU15_08760 [Candidatus Sedimenticola sp. (ex Thyasira tokunagai)]